jgi:hypothetical protein
MTAVIHSFCAIRWMLYSRWCRATGEREKAAALGDMVEHQEQCQQCREYLIWSNDQGTVKEHREARNDNIGGLS